MGAAIITFDPFVDDIRAVYHFRWDEFKYDVWGRGSIEMGWSSYTGELTLILKAGQKIFVLEVSQIYWAFRRRKKPSSNLVDYSALCRKTTQLSMTLCERNITWTIHGIKHRPIQSLWFCLLRYASFLRFSYC